MNETFKNLIKRIISKTEEKSLQWKTTPIRDNYLCEIAGMLFYIRSKIYISYIIDNAITISITSKEEEPIINLKINGNEAFYDSARKLFEIVRYQVLKIDETLKDMKDYLENL